MNCHCCHFQYTQVYSNTYLCDNCRHVHRIYPGNSIKYHQEQYRDIERRDNAEIDLNNNVTKLFHEKRKEICSNRITYVSKYLDENDVCLDIGAGAGTFATHLKPHVSEIECTELTPCLIAEVENLGFKTYDQDFLQIKFNRKYDIVFAWHVLEHVDDPDRFLLKIKELTNKYVIIEVPLLLSLNGFGRRRELKNPTIDNYDGHAHYFSKQSFETIASKYFNILEICEGVQTPALLAVMELKQDEL